MEILPSLLSWIDNSVRTVKSNISDLVNDPVGHTEKQLTNTYSTLLKSLGYSEKDQEDYQVATRDNPEVLHRMKQSENVDVGQFLGAGTFISKGAKLWNPVAEQNAGKLKNLYTKNAIEAFTPESVATIAENTYKNRSKVIDMSIDDFLSLAQPLENNAKSNVSKSIRDEGKQFNSIPQLYIKEEGDTARVVGHEGRNRALQLKSEGYTIFPVEIRGNTRWSEQGDPTKFDYKAEWPTGLLSETGDKTLPFPISREQATLPYSPQIGNPDYKKIWQKTGTWLDTPDKIPLQELSDKSSSLNVRKMTSTSDGEMISGPLQNTVGDHLIHDELFKAYPDLKDIPAFLDYGKSVPNHGVFTNEGNLISVSGKDYGNARSIFLHELQHAIQRKEGMGRGGSPEAIPNDPSTKDVFYRALDRLKAKGIKGDEAKTIAADTIYHVLYGEGLARATQRRADMTAVERLLNYPPDSFDYPIEKSIVRK